MALDFSKGCVNFRDIGECVNIISSRSLLPIGKLFRGGKLDFITSAAQIYNPSTIINLRKSKDIQTFGAYVFDFPISNNYEKYETSNRQVRIWLNKVIKVFEDEYLAYPVLIHCTSGKDRTGVVVATLLKILEIPDEVIVDEYLLSEGEVRFEWIEQAIAGIGNPECYFNRLNVEKVRRNISNL
ncbi:tyrosine-protein phosphatase [Pseudanabaena sp. PCC 6802]|uniref:tyrosine-protein phosphatase n=1 Tax=Pseudanabaena sp. PCC 6802 TaxID=118173 RepID=UPI000379FE94|nr:tyrosine-protein phosphatase [Pseudanabaena sp. PCC 6802]